MDIDGLHFKATTQGQAEVECSRREKSSSFLLRIELRKIKAIFFQEGTKDKLALYCFI